MNKVFLQAAMDDECDPDLAVEIHLYIERLLNAGLRTRLITLIKVPWLGCCALVP